MSNANPALVTFPTDARQVGNTRKSIFKPVADFVAAGIDFCVAVYRIPSNERNY